MQFGHQMDKNKVQSVLPGLYLVSTPIGNMEDITLRALNILKKSDVILCEDTRRSGKLLSHFKIESKLLSYHKFNERQVSSKIVNFIKNNKVVSMVTDSGTPTISDPGKVLVRQCIKENLKIYPIPGPSAVTSAVSVSGFSDQYMFYGFLPKKENQLDNVLKSLSHLNYSIVFFIPASKINFYVLKFKKYFLDRKILIAKEMTKIYEQFIRDEVDSIEKLDINFKGELTIILSEKNISKKDKNIIDESVKIEIKKMLKKYTHKDVVDFISKKEKISKKIVYDFCLKLKK